MKILFFFGLLAVLNIFSCAEVSTDNPVIEASDVKLSSMEKLPVELLRKIFEYLDHDFWRIASASRVLRSLFNISHQTNLHKTLKYSRSSYRWFKENDKELKYLLPIHKFFCISVLNTYI